MKAADVFTPGRFPTVTYVGEHLVEQQRQLKMALDAGLLVTISGPSKSGKTVFVERCIGRDNLIQVTGAGVSTSADLWLRVFDMIGTPVVRTATSVSSLSGTISGTGKFTTSAILKKVEGELGGSASYTSESGETESLHIDLLQLLIKELANTGMTVFIDDFHYIPRDVQSIVAMQIKQAIQSEVRIICASVPYHSDDVMRSNLDIMGRIVHINFDYWKGTTLKKIAFQGFAELGIRYEESMLDKLAEEAAGSPQLMQYLCLTTCHVIGKTEKTSSLVFLEDNAEILESVCKQTAPSIDYSSVVDRMKEGPKARGSMRNIHVTKFGWQGDVYRLLVKAISLDPPRLNFRYNDLMERIKSICIGDLPSGSSTTSACFHAATIVNDTANSTIVEWDGETDVFDIRDPYLLFYLRWSGAAG